MEPYGSLDSAFNQRISDVDSLFNLFENNVKLTKDNWKAVSYYFGGDESNKKQDFKRHVDDYDNPSFKAVSKVINRNSEEYQRKVIGWYSENNTKFYFDGIMIVNPIDDSVYDMQIKRYDRLFNSLDIEAKLTYNKTNKFKILKKYYKKR